MHETLTSFLRHAVMGIVDGRLANCQVVFCTLVPTCVSSNKSRSSTSLDALRRWLEDATTAAYLCSASGSVDNIKVVRAK